MILPTVWQKKRIGCSLCIPGMQRKRREERMDTRRQIEIPAIAVSAYLIAPDVLIVLAPGLRKAEIAS